MKTQTVAQLSRPLALKLVLTAEFERARISSQAATLFWVDCRPEGRQTPPDSDEAVRSWTPPQSEEPSMVAGADLERPTTQL